MLRIIVTKLLYRISKWLKINLIIFLNKLFFVMYFFLIRYVLTFFFINMLPSSFPLLKGFRWFYKKKDVKQMSSSLSRFIFFYPHDQQMLNTISNCTSYGVSVFTIGLFSHNHKYLRVRKWQIHCFLTTNLRPYAFRIDHQPDFNMNEDCISFQNTNFLLQSV